MKSPFDVVRALIDPRYNRARWRLFGADGRVLDVLENAANHIGQSVNLPPPATGNRNEVSILDVRSENPANPETVTINLAVKMPPGGVPATSLILPQAQIDWGSGGAQNTAFVDIVEGTSITVAASLVRVSGIYFAPISGAGLNGIQVNANLSYGTRGGSYVAPGFTDFGSAANTASFVSVVPPFAKDVSVLAVALDGGAAPTQLADLSIFMCSDDGGTVPFARLDQNSATAPNAVFPLTYPLPGWVRSLKITNNSAHSAFISARYGLAL